MLQNCPRCKNKVLDLTDCGQSSLYGSQHLLCIPCCIDEEGEIEEAGTNNLPGTLRYYGPSNDTNGGPYDTEY